jgi:hypothetical protein
MGGENLAYTFSWTKRPLNKIKVCVGRERKRHVSKRIVGMFFGAWR